MPTPDVVASAAWSIRDYRDEDEPSWLRCRVLSFLASTYYDDVKTVRTFNAGSTPGPGTTRPANGWYLKAGFTEEHRYVHVYKGWDEPGEGWASPEGLSAPVMAFAHGSIQDLDDLRARHNRVHVCRQYLLRLPG